MWRRVRTLYANSTVHLTYGAAYTVFFPVVSMRASVPRRAFRIACAQHGTATAREHSHSSSMHGCMGTTLKLLCFFRYLKEERTLTVFDRSFCNSGIPCSSRRRRERRSLVDTYDILCSILVDHRIILCMTTWAAVRQFQEASRVKRGTTVLLDILLNHSSIMFRNLRPVSIRNLRPVSS